jgi:hypothetical protein
VLVKEVQDLTQVVIAKPKAIILIIHFPIIKKDEIQIDFVLKKLILIIIIIKK